MKPHSVPPEKNHWKKAQMKLNEKYFTNPNTCFLHINRFYLNQKL